MSIHAEANAHSADWLMSVFVNELALPYVRSQQGQCEQQCRRILANTVRFEDKQSMLLLLLLLNLLESSRFAAKKIKGILFVVKIEGALKNFKIWFFFSYSRSSPLRTTLLQRN